MHAWNPPAGRNYGPTLAPPALGGTRMVKEQCFVVMVSLRSTLLQKTGSSGNSVSRFAHVLSQCQQMCPGPPPFGNMATTEITFLNLAYLQISCQEIFFSSCPHYGRMCLQSNLIMHRLELVFPSRYSFYVFPNQSISFYSSLNNFSYFILH